MFDDIETVLKEYDKDQPSMIADIRETLQEIQDGTFFENITTQSNEISGNDSLVHATINTGKGQLSMQAVSKDRNECQENSELVILDEVEFSLQSFAGVIECGTRHERITFQTVKCPGTDDEIDEILSIYGDSTVVKYASSEIPMKCREQARRMQKRMWEEISLFGKRKAIRWKLLYRHDINDSESPETFVGFFSLFNIDRLLDPGVSLRPEFFKRGIATKACMCLLTKLFSNPSWLGENFEGIQMTINPKNSASLALKDAVLGGFLKEDPNPKRKDGVWIHNRKVYGGDATKHVVRRKFVCPSLGSVEASLTSRTERKICKTVRVVYDVEHFGSYKVTILEKYGKLGLIEVHTNQQDANRIVRQLSWYKCQVSAHVPVEVVNTFELELPDETRRQNLVSQKTFFLLFFLNDDSNRLEQFDMMKVDRTRGRVKQTFIAFNCLRSAFNQPKIRIVQSQNEATSSFYTGYLLQLDANVFFKERQTDLLECVQSVWSTGNFSYSKKKRKFNGGLFKGRLRLERIILT